MNLQYLALQQSGRLEAARMHCISLKAAVDGYREELKDRPDDRPLQEDLQAKAKTLARDRKYHKTESELLKIREDKIEENRKTMAENEQIERDLDETISEY